MKREAEPLAVTVCVVTPDYQPIPATSGRMVFCSGDWQAPEAGYRFVTGADGAAAFHGKAAIVRRWTWQAVGFTPISIPIRTHFLRIGIELETTMPVPPKDELQAFRWLSLLDVDRWADGTCSGCGVRDVYSQDQQGRFTRRSPRRAYPGLQQPWEWKPETIEGREISAPGYQESGTMLSLDEGCWSLKITLKRWPVPKFQ